MMEIIRRILGKRGLERIKKSYSDRAKKYSDHYVLTKDQEEQVKAFYGRITDEKFSLAFHNYYTEKTGAFYKEYVPEDLYFCFLDPYYNSAKETSAFSNKCYSDVIFQNIKMPETVIKRINGFWYSSENQLVNKDFVDEIIRSQKELVIKQAQSSCGGKGVFFVSQDDGDVLKQFWKIVSEIVVDLIVQKPLKQHSAIALANESSVNTLRILTFFRSDGTLKVCSAILRMGISGSKVDNSSSGGVTCGIDSNGHCREAGYYSFYAKVNAGKKIFTHPTSNIPFKDIVIPNFDKVVDLLERAQIRIPHFRLVSWDVAIAENGDPVLIEANLLKGGVEFHQLNNGPLFGDETEAIFSEVFKH